MAIIARNTSEVSEIVKRDVEQFRELKAKLERLETLKAEVQKEVDQAASVSTKATAKWSS